MKKILWKVINRLVVRKQNFEENKEDYNQGNVCGNDDVVYGHGARRTNSNIAKRR